MTVAGMRRVERAAVEADAQAGRMGRKLNQDRAALLPPPCGEGGLGRMPSQVGVAGVVSGVPTRRPTPPPARKSGVHALRTRAAGQRRFVSMHVLVPGLWTVKQGHDLSEKIEGEVAEALPQSTFFIHIEPSEDPASFEDQSLDRERRDTQA